MDNVIKKLRFDIPGCIIDAPESIEKEFSDRGFSLKFPAAGKSKHTIIFVHDKNEYLYHLENSLRHIEFDSILWISYPKKSSGTKTDIHRDILWQLSQPFGIRPVSQISIDDTWSAMRFRPTDQVKKSK